MPELIGLVIRIVKVRFSQVFYLCGKLLFFCDFPAFGQVGISVDRVWCHEVFAKYRHRHFSLAADFEPKGKADIAYGAYRAGEGVSERHDDLSSQCGPLEVVPKKCATFFPDSPM
jgi:hypothetical protein